MDSDSQSVHSDTGGDVKTAFRKPAIDSSGRKYRRYSPIRESLSDGSPKHAGPELSHEDSGRIHFNLPVRNDDKGEIHRHSDRSHSHKHSDRHYSKSSHGHSRLDDYNRPEKHGDDERSHHRSSRSDRSRSRDHPRGTEIYRDKYDVAVFKSKNREREALFLEHRNKDRDSRMHAHPEDAERERHRSSGDHRVDGKYRAKESYRSELKEIAQGKKKFDDLENRTKDQYIAEPVDHVAGYDVASKKQKFGEKRVSKFTSAIEADVEESSSKPSEEGKMPAQVSVSEVANDVTAAKIAAMKAAELVNKNLVGGVGTGLMTADQKKKLLWGNKKATGAEEPGHRWDNATFSDQERQEKFNKLMGLKGHPKAELKSESQSKSDPLQEDKQRELQLELEKQYTAGLRRRDGRTVGLGL